MTEESLKSTMNEDVGQPTIAIDTIQDTMNRFLNAADVDVVYGKPVKQGDTQIIPAAEVLSAMGFGIGYGSGTNTQEDQENVGGGGGGGGGGRVLSRPVAVIIASPQGVRVEPILDITKIALAGLTAAGFMMGMIVKMLKGTRD